MKIFVKISLVVVAVAAIGWFVISRIDFSEPINIEDYTPSEECSGAYASITANRSDEEYDIEKTVRIMNSLEVAQSQSESFVYFLEYMARQDYRGVARDVIEVKRLLFPIIEEMNELRKQKKELSSIWFCLKNASMTVAQDKGASGVIALASGNLGAVCSCADAAFSAYQEQQNLKRNIEKRLDRLRRQYITYIEAYTPIYLKYMEEWNRLCLNKDKAYMNLYAGDVVDALNAAQKVLDQHPVNREGLLLKAIALVRLGNGERDKIVLPEDVAQNQRLRVNGQAEYERSILQNQCYFTAQRTLDEYIRLYPDKAAPALLVSGILKEQLGHATQAVALYEQAAAEYPRQAEALADLLDAYSARTYLNQSVEGRYLMNYYRSTMEGAGIFSPNFRKAALFARQGRMDDSQDEIYRHFFRRGSQCVQDCLLSDMQYCEDYLFGSFRPMLLESSYMDIGYKQATKIMGLKAKKGEIDITLTNRTDRRIENVRIFLCIHTVGMYKDDYDVVRMPQTRNVIEPYETVCFEDVDISPRQVEDVTRIRAIVMTDDKICWVDAKDVKSQTAIAGIRRAIDGTKNAVREHGEDVMRRLSVSFVNMERTIKENTKINLDKGWTGTTVYVKFPRILALLSPEFTINPIEDTDCVVRPKEDKIVGDYIQLKFEPGSNLFSGSNDVNIYMYSQSLSFKISLTEQNGTWQVARVKEI